jgi:hypothetical protein
MSSSQISFRPICFIQTPFISNYDWRKSGNATNVTAKHLFLFCLYSREGRDTILLFLVHDDVYPALVDSIIIVLYINGTRDLLTYWPNMSFSEVLLYRVITPRLSAVCRGKPSLLKTRHRSIVNNKWVLPEAVFHIPAPGKLPLI